MARTFEPRGAFLVSGSGGTNGPSPPFNSPGAIRRALFAFASDNLFELESLDDWWRKASFSSQHLVELSTVDPRPPRPGRLTTSPIYIFA